MIVDKHQTWLNAAKRVIHKHVFSARSGRDNFGRDSRRSTAKLQPHRLGELHPTTTRKRPLSNFSTGSIGRHCVGEPVRRTVPCRNAFRGRRGTGPVRRQRFAELSVGLEFVAHRTRFFSSPVRGLVCQQASSTNAWSTVCSTPVGRARLGGVLLTTTSRRFQFNNGVGARFSCHSETRCYIGSKRPRESSSRTPLSTMMKYSPMMLRKIIALGVFKGLYKAVPLGAGT
jgi:hypothetical protein